MSETAEREILVREFPVELAADGRTIEMRIVPYNQPGRAADPPEFRPYQEVFLPRSFERQLAAPNRVAAWLNFEHEQGIRGIVGHGTHLRDAPDALYGSFRVHENADGDKALQLVNDGVLGGVSVEFKALQSNNRGGVVERVRAHLVAVALARTGMQAYKSAEVLAVRTAPLEPVAVMPADLAQRVAALGVESLHRMAVTRRPWDGSAERFTDEQFQASCLIDGGGDVPAKTRCSLPVLEPDGSLNVNALASAAGAVNDPAAARKLARYYRLAEMEVPPRVMQMAAA